MREHGSSTGTTHHFSTTSMNKRENVRVKRVVLLLAHLFLHTVGLDIEIRVRLLFLTYSYSLSTNTTSRYTSSLTNKSRSLCFNQKDREDCKNNVKTNEFRKILILPLFTDVLSISGFATLHFAARNQVTYYS